MDIRLGRSKVQAGNLRTVIDKRIIPCRVGIGEHRVVVLPEFPLLTCGITGEGSLQRILVNFFDWVVDEAELDGDLLSEVFADSGKHLAAKGTLEVSEFDDCEAGIIRALGRRQLQYAIEVFLLNDDWSRLVHAGFVWLVEHRAISTHQEKASANRHNNTHHNQHFRFTGDLHWIAP